jgi:hypothetical protein
MDKQELRNKINACNVQEGHPIWKYNCLNLKDDILRKNPDNFLSFSTIQQTMFVGNAEYTFQEFEEMKDKIDLQELNDNDKFTVGHQHPLYPTTGNTIHHRYHLYQFERYSDKSINQFSSIIEIGGGYGNTARLVKKMGFSGEYTIYDLQEFKCLQEYYLSHHNTRLTERELDAHYDLLIATWSISEIPMHEREVFRQLNFDNAIIAFSDTYVDIQDNLSWFDEFTEFWPEKHSWVRFGHPYIKNSYYLIGVKI